MSRNLNSQKKQAWCKKSHSITLITSVSIGLSKTSVVWSVPVPALGSPLLGCLQQQHSRKEAGGMENPTAGESSHPGAPRRGASSCWRMRSARQLIPAESSAWALQLICQSLFPSCVRSVLPAWDSWRKRSWKWTGVNAAPNSRAIGARATENSSMPFADSSPRAGSSSSSSVCLAACFPA